MRVLLISHTCQSQVEGQPKAQLLGAIPGVDLHVLTPNRWREYGVWRRPSPPARGEATFSLHMGRVACPWMGPAQSYMHFYPGLPRLLRRLKPDIIDIWEEPWAQVSAQACWLRNRLLPNTKIVSETEQNINRTYPAPFENWRAYTLANADFVVGRSEEAVRVVRAKGYSGPAESVGNAVNTAMFRPLDRAECRRALALSGFVAGYVGRLVEEKGLMDMVDALVAPACPPSANLLFVGAGPFKTALEERAAVLGKSDRVRFLPPRPLSELPQVMNALDVLTLPSRTTKTWKEQFGRVIIEAHACGTPVIGSDSGAIPEVVGRGGLIAPESNPGELALRYASLASNPERARAMGETGRRRVEDCYTWGQVAARMHEIYQSVSRQRRNPISAGRIQFHEMPG